MQFFRKWGDISVDPEFPYRVGRLIGSSEMAGHMLQESADPEQQKYGTLILQRVEWFLGEPLPAASDKPKEKITHDGNAKTLVIPPPVST